MLSTRKVGDEMRMPGSVLRQRRQSVAVIKEGVERLNVSAERHHMREGKRGSFGVLNFSLLFVIAEAG